MSRRGDAWPDLLISTLTKAGAGTLKRLLTSLLAFTLSS